MSKVGNRYRSRLLMCIFFVRFLFLRKENTLHWPLLVFAFPSKSVIELSLPLWLETLSSTLDLCQAWRESKGLGEYS